MSNYKQIRHEKQGDFKTFCRKDTRRRMEFPAAGNNQVIGRQFLAAKAKFFILWERDIVGFVEAGKVYAKVNVAVCRITLY